MDDNLVSGTTLGETEDGILIGADTDSEVSQADDETTMRIPITNPTPAQISEQQNRDYTVPAPGQDYQEFLRSEYGIEQPADEHGDIPVLSRQDMMNAIRADKTEEQGGRPTEDLYAYAASLMDRPDIHTSTAQQAVVDYYKSNHWQDNPAALEALTDIGDGFRQAYGSEQYDTGTLMRTLPVPFTSVKIEKNDSPQGIINRWRDLNLEALEKTNSPEYRVSKNQLLHDTPLAAEAYIQELAHRTMDGSSGAADAINRVFAGVLQIPTHAIDSVTGWDTSDWVTMTFPTRREYNDRFDSKVLSGIGNMIPFLAGGPITYGALGAAGVGGVADTIEAGKEATYQIGIVNPGASARAMALQAASSGVDIAGDALIGLKWGKALGVGAKAAPAAAETLTTGGKVALGTKIAAGGVVSEGGARLLGNLSERQQGGTTTVSEGVATDAAIGGMLSLGAGAIQATSAHLDRSGGIFSRSRQVDVDTTGEPQTAQVIQSVGDAGRTSTDITTATVTEQVFDTDAAAEVESAGEVSTNETGTATEGAPEVVGVVVGPSAIVPEGSTNVHALDGGATLVRQPGGLYQVVEQDGSVRAPTEGTFIVDKKHKERIEQARANNYVVTVSPKGDLVIKMPAEDGSVGASVLVETKSPEEVSVSERAVDGAETTQPSEELYVVQVDQPYSPNSRQTMHPIASDNTGKVIFRRVVNTLNSPRSMGAAYAGKYGAGVKENARGARLHATGVKALVDAASSGAFNYDVFPAAAEVAGLIEDVKSPETLQRLMNDFFDGKLDAPEDGPYKMAVGIAIKNSIVDTIAKMPLDSADAATNIDRLNQLFIEVEKVIGSTTNLAGQTSSVLAQDRTLPMGEIREAGKRAYANALSQESKATGIPVEEMIEADQTVEALDKEIESLDAKIAKEPDTVPTDEARVVTEIEQTLKEQEEAFDTRIDEVTTTETEATDKLKGDIRDAQQEIQQREKELKDMQAEDIQLLEGELKAIDTEYQQATDEVNELEKLEIGEAERVIASNESLIKQKNQEIVAVHAQDVATVEQVIERTKAEQAQEKVDFDRKEKAGIEAMGERKQNLTTDLANAKQQLQKKLDKEQSTTAANERIQTINKRIAQLEERLGKYNAGIAAARSEMSKQHSETLKELDSLLQGVKKHGIKRSKNKGPSVTQIRADIAKATEAKAEAVERVGKLKEAANKKRKSLLDERDRQRTSVNSLLTEARKAPLEKRLTKGGTPPSRIRNRIEKLKASIDNGNERLKGIKAAAKEKRAKLIAAKTKKVDPIKKLLSKAKADLSNTKGGPEVPNSVKKLLREQRAATSRKREKATEAQKAERKARREALRAEQDLIILGRRIMEWEEFANSPDISAGDRKNIREAIAQARGLVDPTKGLGFYQARMMDWLGSVGTLLGTVVGNTTSGIVMPILMAFGNIGQVLLITAHKAFHKNVPEGMSTGIFPALTAALTTPKFRKAMEAGFHTVKHGDEILSDYTAEDLDRGSIKQNTSTRDTITETDITPDDVAATPIDELLSKRAEKLRKKNIAQDTETLRQRDAWDKISQLAFPGIGKFAPTDSILREIPKQIYRLFGYGYSKSMGRLNAATFRLMAATDLVSKMVYSPIFEELSRAGNKNNAILKGASAAELAQYNYSVKDLRMQARANALKVEKRMDELGIPHKKRHRYTREEEYFQRLLPRAVGLDVYAILGELTTRGTAAGIMGGIAETISSVDENQGRQFMISRFGADIKPLGIVVQMANSLANIFNQSARIVGYSALEQSLSRAARFALGQPQPDNIQGYTPTQQNANIAAAAIGAAGVAWALKTAYDEMDKPEEEQQWGWIGEYTTARGNVGRLRREAFKESGGMTQSFWYRNSDGTKTYISVGDTPLAMVWSFVGYFADKKRDLQHGVVKEEPDAKTSSLVYMGLTAYMGALANVNMFRGIVTVQDAVRSAAGGEATWDVKLGRALTTVPTKMLPAINNQTIKKLYQYMENPPDVDRKSWALMFANMPVIPPVVNMVAGKQIYKQPLNMFGEHIQEAPKDSIGPAFFLSRLFTNEVNDLDVNWLAHTGYRINSPSTITSNADYSFVADYESRRQIALLAAPDTRSIIATFREQVGYGPRQQHIQERLDKAILSARHNAMARYRSGERAPDPEGDPPA